jgi:hypothetical protein
MKRSFYLLSILLMTGLISGCASMSKKECLSADWHAIGYSDGTRGIHHNNLAKHRQSCGKYEVFPDEEAYHAGWDRGIRSYCTSDRGYRTGAVGKPYRNICPEDVAENFRHGWERGVRSYCTADNGLRQGLAGQRYRGVCPSDLEPAFHDYYRLGRDVRRARVEQRGNSQKLSRVEGALAAEKDPRRADDLLREAELLQHLEDRSYTHLIGLEACMDDDWFETGYREGEAGYPRRASEITAGCRGYGIAGDRRGYREGWLQGNRHYCTYESGLYIGQSNQIYSGVCSGRDHHRFWRGYEEGRERYRSERWARHPRPEKKHVTRQPVASHDHQKSNRAAEPEHKQAEQPKAVKHKADRAADDNRDKLKHPMPEQSRKPELKEKRELEDDDDGHDVHEKKIR